MTNCSVRALDQCNQTLLAAPVRGIAFTGGNLETGILSNNGPMHARLEQLLSDYLGLLTFLYCMRPQR